MQRSAGNRAVTELVAGRRPDRASLDFLRAAGKTQPSELAEATIQRRRSERPADDNHLKRLDKQLDGVTAKVATPERLDQVWRALGTRYGEYAAKGQGLWDRLANARSRLIESPEREAASLSEVRAGYDRRYRDHYITAIKPLGAEGSGKYSASSSGFVDKRPDQPEPNVYLSNFDLEAGIPEIVDAYATKDQARIRDAEEKARGEAGFRAIGLPSSEILWQQLLETATVHFGERKKERADALMARIAGVTVNQAQNIPTLQVVFMAYPNGEFWDTADHVWYPGTEEFRAILATPNVAPAVFLLLDHLDQVERRFIESITTRGGRDHFIDIKYTESDPSSHNVAIAVGLTVLVGLALGAGYLLRRYHQ